MVSTPRGGNPAGRFLWWRWLEKMRGEPGPDPDHEPDGTRRQHRPARLRPMVRAAPDRGPRVARQRVRLHDRDRGLHGGIALPGLACAAACSIYRRSCGRRRDRDLRPGALPEDPGRGRTAGRARDLRRLRRLRPFPADLAFGRSLPEVRPRMALDRWLELRLPLALTRTGAQLCLFFKRHGRALELLKLLLQEHPRHARAWSIAGFLYAEKGRYKDAAAALEHADRPQPPTTRPCCSTSASRCRSWSATTKPSNAWQRALRARPEARSRLVWHRPVADPAAAAYAEAIARLTEASRLQPFNAFARYQLAAAWFKLGEHEKVRAEYRHVKGFDPKIAEHIFHGFRSASKDPDIIGWRLRSRSVEQS